MAGNRNPVLSLKGPCIAVEAHPRNGDAIPDAAEARPVLVDLAFHKTDIARWTPHCHTA